MKKIDSKVRAIPDQQVFTEGIDYFSEPNESIWGQGDAETIKVLGSISPSGTWLDLGAGDGRYASRLMQHLDRLVASDIDLGALTKLWYRCSPSVRDRVDTLALDIKSSFPFRKTCFDGVISTGTLHYFTQDIILHALTEIDRILKPGGTFVLDFAYGIHRRSEEGEVIRPGAPHYEEFPFETAFRPILGNYRMNTFSSSFSDYISHTRYTLSGSFVLVTAIKPTDEV